MTKTEWLPKIRKRQNRTIQGRTLGISQLEGTHAAEVQQEVPWMFTSLPVLISGQTNITVSSAKFPTWTASTTSLSGAHKQRLTLLTVLPLEMCKGECIICWRKEKLQFATVFVFWALISYYGVVVALQTNIWFVNAGTVAVFVAAALRWTVIPNKSKVALASSWRHTGPIHTALFTDWLTLPRSTVLGGGGDKQHWTKPFWT